MPVGHGRIKLRPLLLWGAGGASSDVNDGTYTLSESGTVAGYTNGTNYVCTGTGTQVDGTHVTVHVGQSESCTITNTARPVWPER